ncbi:MAG: dehydrogenase, partial [Verrucomicrobiales bacterium]|nr:dehydrogenase [Verrucomicrobiales bacterium]
MRPAVRPPLVLRAQRTPALILALASLAAAATAVALRAGAVPGPLDPAAAHATFATEPGLSVDLIAAEPVVRSPAALAWDEQGRLHVAENPDYPVGPAPGQNPQGAIVRLTDTDGDGLLDQRAVLAEGLRYPNGLMPWRGGWLVTDAPDLLWLCDTNHDARADVREVWFTGFATNQTTQLRANAPTLGPDGWIYVARGLVGGTVTSPRWPRLQPVDLQAGDFRFRPDGSAAEAIGGNAQFGLVLDDVGRRFLVSNRNPLRHAVLDPRWWARHPWLPLTEVVQDVSPTGYEAKVFPRSLDTTTAGFMPEFLAAPHAGTFTSACGIHQHFGGGLGAEREGSWLICEPAQNLVQRQIATARGATFSSRRATESGEFLTSTDPWFHPVFATTGPDG